MKWKTLLQRDDGGVWWIFTFAACVLVLIPLLLLLIDNWYIKTIDRETVEAIDDINRDIYQLLDIQHSAFTTDFQISDTAAAYDLFRLGLQNRFKVDASLNPLPGSLVKGTIIIDEWRIVSRADLPVSDGHGRTLTNPGILTQIRIPIQTPMLGVAGNKPVFVTTEIYR